MNNEKGTIYLIQPAELVGTERYKIGCSAKNDLERCKKGYKKGTRYMDIRECDCPFAVEREVKTQFNTKFKLVAGNEYFEGNEADIKKEFNDVVSKFTSLKRDVHDDILVNPLLQDMPFFDTAIVTAETKEWLGKTDNKQILKALETAYIITQDVNDIVSFKELSDHLRESGITNMSATKLGRELTALKLTSKTAHRFPDKVKAARMGLRLRNETDPDLDTHN